jgi:uncharacterized membrane-anchored protein
MPPLFRPVFLLAPLVLTGAALAQESAPAGLPAAVEATPAPVQLEPVAQFQAIGVRFDEGPARGELGTRAQISVPEGFVFTDGDGSRSILRAFGNLTGSDEVGLLAPRSFDWFVTFDFEEVGYVKDDEKDKLDADAMLKALREGNARGNEYRRSKGLPTLTIEGFAIPPRYNPETQNLEWAVRLRHEDGEGESVNHNTRILGRHGVMVVTLVCDPEDLETHLPTYRGVMSAFSYQEGGKYAEYRPGDKIAEYGLSALVVGGGLALAAKTGLLQKMFKPILVGLLVVAAGAKRLFSRGDRDAG